MPPLCPSEGDRFDVFSNEHFADPLNSQLDKLTCSSSRRVRFNREDKVFNPDLEYYTDEDIKIKWCNILDLQEIRQEAKEVSSLIRHHAKTQYCELAMAHRKTTLILASDFRSLVKLTPTTPDQDLSIWCSRDDGRRGLERFASKVYGCFRRRDVSEARIAVLAEQNCQRTQQFCDPELIAAKSRAVSLRARTFALFLAGADEKQVSKRDLEQPRQAPPRKRSKVYHVDTTTQIIDVN
jgi:hypothetical protein